MNFQIKKSDEFTQKKLRLDQRNIFQRCVDSAHSGAIGQDHVLGVSNLLRNTVVEISVRSFQRDISKVLQGFSVKDLDFKRAFKHPNPPMVVAANGDIANSLAREVSGDALILQQVNSNKFFLLVVQVKRILLVEISKEVGETLCVHGFFQLRGQATLAESLRARRSFVHFHSLFLGLLPQQCQLLMVFLNAF